MENITKKNQHQSSIRNWYKRCKKILHELLLQIYIAVHIHVAYKNNFNLDSILMIRENIILVRI